MTVGSGPTLAGGVSRNNQFTATITPGVIIPAGAMVWVIGGTNASDSAVLSIKDSVNNVEFNQQAFVSLPGVSGAIVAAYLVVPQSIPAAGTITLTSDTRGNWDLNCVYFTGVEGDVYSQDTQISTVAITNPSTSTRARPAMNLLSLLAVLGPSTDGFTQDPAWGTDQKGSVARTNVTVHASGRAVPSNAPDWDGQTPGAAGPLPPFYTYSPTLGTARRTLVYSAAFT